MPDDIRAELERFGLMDAYRARPAYQQNDYLAWIGRAKRPATREKRLAQMLDELRRGDAYMNMRYTAKRG
ncbi:MAG: YdeI/OmpD-associated family protein [Chloroflexi bacterium]|nr:YdeI/OmpD-associated family protein [Chloroflexota bacterium]